MKNEDSKGQRLFLSAGFDSFQVGLASDEDVWIAKNEQQGHIADLLSDALETTLQQCCFVDLKIYLLNGPGSTLGIRTLCAFIRTLLALNKIGPHQVFTCDHLHFAQACLILRNNESLPNICARVNLSKILCLTPSGDLHIASDVEGQEALWLPHPCSQDRAVFSFCLDEILPILRQNYLWQQTDCPDIVSF